MDHSRLLVCGSLFVLGTCVWKKDVHSLVLGPHDYVTFCGYKDITGVIKSRVLRWEDGLGYSMWANVIIRDGGSRRVREDVMREAEVRMMPSLAL